jgi:cation diffusion facilitator CzcD-associated flavoprotein CzcO
MINKEENSTPNPGCRAMEDISVPLNNAPAFTPSKKLRVGIIGAGYSGLIMAHKLMYEHVREMETIVDFTIYEAKDVPGGTWVDNTYPGGIL